MSTEKDMEAPRRQKAEEKPEWAMQIRAFRGTRTQGELAHLCDVSQMTVSRWESGKDEPSPDLYATLASIAEGPQRALFWERSGYEMGTPDFYARRPGLKRSRVPSVMRLSADRDTMAGGWKGLLSRLGLNNSKSSPEPKVSLPGLIPLLDDSRLLGTDAAGINSGVIYLPTDLFEPDSELWAVRVADNMMYPTIQVGTIVVIDVSTTDRTELDGHIVAVRGLQGIIVRRLHRDGETYCLLGAHPAPSVRVLPNGAVEDSIVGDVVLWLGTPEDYRSSHG